VINTIPNAQEANIATNGIISATFSEDMYTPSISDSSFVLHAGTASVSGKVSMVGRTATFSPKTNLTPNTLYTATITTGVIDPTRNALTREFTWNFTTGSVAVNETQAPVTLGAAASFAVLAGSTVTNTGLTTITGNIGVNPGSSITGFGPGLVTGGAIHTANTLTLEAQNSLTVAYNNLAGRSTGPVSVAGNLGGSTLSPGLYKSTSGLEVSSGDLTLDAKGNADAVFIFQIASTLDIAVGRQVVLIGGAKASNVYWQVGTSANIGSNASFKGSILADQSISLQTGARVDGRLLARIGGVTLQGNVIVLP
jgi:hypothetical protein